jgi:hypothetical protein
MQIFSLAGPIVNEVENLSSPSTAKKSEVTYHSYLIRDPSLACISANLSSNSLAFRNPQSASRLVIVVVVILLVRVPSDHTDPHEQT